MTEEELQGLEQHFTKFCNGECWVCGEYGERLITEIRSLQKRLDITQEWLDKFQGDCAELLLRAHKAEQKVDELQRLLCSACQDKEYNGIPCVEHDGREANDRFWGRHNESKD